MSQHGTETEQGNAEDNQPNAAYWLNQIESGKKAAYDHFENTKDAWAEYTGKTSRTNTKRSYRFPIFWSCVRTLQPAIYSSQPIPIANKTTDGDDPVSSAATIISERLAKFLIRGCPFDRALFRARDDLIIGSKATTRVVIAEPEFDLVQEPVTASQDEFGNLTYFDSLGASVSLDSKIETATDGQLYISIETENPKVLLIPVSLFDIVHSPGAQHWEEIEWIAFRLRLSRKAATEEFGEEIASKLKYSEASKDESLTNKQSSGVEVWEVWDKNEKTVCWVSDCYKERVLKCEQDPYELANFFPCPPFVLGTVGPDSLYPIPDYCQLEDLLKQIQGAYKRACNLLRSTKRRGVYNKNIEELAKLQNETDEAEYIAVSDWQGLNAQGGIQAAVQHFPTQELVTALNEMIVAIQTLEQFFFEMWGIPDILRGTSQTPASATEQKIKERYASLRFSSTQRDFQELARASIELLVDAALKEFSDSYILEVVGKLPANLEPYGTAAINLLRKDRIRQIRIEIETDSTILANEEEDRQRRSEITNSIVSGLAQIAQSENLPKPLQDFVGELIIYSIKGLRDSKNLEDGLRAALLKAKEGADDPAPPPPPDYEAQKLVLEQQKIITQQTKDANDSALKLKELTIKEQDLATKVTLETDKLLILRESEQYKNNLQIQLGQQKIDIANTKEATRTALENAWLQIEQLKSVSAQQVQQAQLELERQTQFFDQQMASNRLQLEQAQTQLTSYEKLLEEKRLSLVAQSTPKRRRARVLRDPLGNMVIESDEEAIQP